MGIEDYLIIIAPTAFAVGCGVFMLIRRHRLKPTDAGKAIAGELAGEAAEGIASVVVRAILRALHH